MAVAALVPLALTALAIPAGAQVSRQTLAGSEPSATTASPPGDTPQAASSVRPLGAYVAVVAEGSKRQLRLVSTSTGRVLRNLGWVRRTADEEPFLDVDLASDGSVWVVRRDSSLAPAYQYRLWRYTGKQAIKSLPYVTSVRVSPDSTRAAVSMLSPDANKDGKGTSALRIVTMRGQIVRTLAQTTFPVNKEGLPTVQIGGLGVAGWLNRAELIVRDGCCDSGSVAIAGADRPSRMSGWPTFSGDGSTTAIGTNTTGTAVLVARNLQTGDGTTVPIQVVGLNTYWVTKSKPRGALVSSTRTERPLESLVDGMVRSARAVPLVVSPKRFPYRGPGRVVQAFV